MSLPQGQGLAPRPPLLFDEEEEVGGADIALAGHLQVRGEGHKVLPAHDRPRESRNLSHEAREGGTLPSSRSSGWNHGLGFGVALLASSLPPSFTPRGM